MDLLKQPNVKQCFLSKSGEHFGVKPLFVKDLGVAMKKKDRFSFVEGIFSLKAILKDIPKIIELSGRTSKMDPCKVAVNLEHTKNKKMLYSIN